MNDQGQNQQVTLRKPVFIGLVAGMVVLGMAVLFLLLRPQPEPLNPGGNAQTSGPTAAPTQGNEQVGYPSGVPGPSTEPLPTKAPVSPEEVTSTFYNWYFSYAGDPLKSGAYTKNELLTTAYRSDMQGFMKTHTGTAPYDPIFCVKNKTQPYNVLYEPAVFFGKRVEVKIRRLDGKYLYSTWLIQQNNKWIIDDITCTP